jgi:hypothetical protein
MPCRGSPVPLSKSAGTKQLKVVHGASATCVLQNAFPGLFASHMSVGEVPPTLRLMETYITLMM